MAFEFPKARMVKALIYDCTGLLQGGSVHSAYKTFVEKINHRVIACIARVQAPILRFQFSKVINYAFKRHTPAPLL